LATNVALLLRVTAPASILRLVRHFPATVAPPIMSGVNSKRVIFSFVLNIFYDLGNFFAF